MSDEEETPRSESLSLGGFFNKYQLLEKRLIQDGFKVEYCGGFCPTQIGGYLPTGEYFHYRSRGTQVSLEVWWENLEPREEHMGWCPASKPGFFMVRHPFRWPEGGWQPAHHTNKHFRRLLRTYYEWKKKPGNIIVRKRTKREILRQIQTTNKRMMRKERKWRQSLAASTTPS